MKRRIAQVLTAVVLVTTLSSCYVYDDPFVWGGGYRAPVYRPGYSYRSYGYPARSYGYPSRSHSHRGHDHGRHSSGHHHHSSRPHHGGHHHR